MDGSSMKLCNWRSAFKEPTSTWTACCATTNTIFGGRSKLAWLNSDWKCWKRETQIIDVVTRQQHGVHIWEQGRISLSLMVTDMGRVVVIPDRTESRDLYCSCSCYRRRHPDQQCPVWAFREPYCYKLWGNGCVWPFLKIASCRKQTGLKAIQIKTPPYPGFMTDLHQPITEIALTGIGRSNRWYDLWKAGQPCQNWLK